MLAPDTAWHCGDGWVCGITSTDEVRVVKFGFVFATKRPNHHHMLDAKRVTGEIAAAIVAAAAARAGWTVAALVRDFLGLAPFDATAREDEQSMFVGLTSPYHYRVHTMTLCPFCDFECSCETVDVGVGDVQVTPYVCHRCGAVQLKPDEQQTEEEKRIGWARGPDPS